MAPEWLDGQLAIVWLGDQWGHEWWVHRLGWMLVQPMDPPLVAQPLSHNAITH